MAQTKIAPDILTNEQMFDEEPLINMPAKENIALWKKESKKTQTPEERFNETFPDREAPDVISDEDMFAVDNSIKGLYASMETSGDTKGDYLQLEESTFNDLKKRKKIRGDLQFKGLVESGNYDEVASSYIEDLKTTFGIPTDEEAALWSWRPGWYKKYGGKIENIPEDAPGVMGKSGRQVMQDRYDNLMAHKNAPEVIEDKDMQEAPEVISDKDMQASKPNMFKDALKSSMQTVAKAFIPGGVTPTGKEKEYIDPIQKGMRDVVISAPQVLGALVQELGERSEEMPKLEVGTPDAIISQTVPAYPIFKAAKALSFKRTDIDDETAEWGKKIIQDNKKWIDKNVPDFGPQGKNKIKDMLYNLGSGATTLGAAVGITALTKNPNAAAVMFGIYQKGKIYQEARQIKLKHKKTGEIITVPSGELTTEIVKNYETISAALPPREAGQLSTLAGGIEGALEYLGLEFLMSPVRGSKLLSGVVKAGTEALQEFSQTVGENLVVKMGGIDAARPVFQGAGMSALIGLILGGGAGTAIDLAQESGVLDDIKNTTGLSADKASQVLKSIVEKQTENIKKTLSSEAGFARIGKEGEAPISKTLTGEIVKRGGLDPEKLAKDYNIKELRESGLGHIIKKGGKSLDDIAKTLQEEGIITVPEGMNPGDYLIEQIKTKTGRKLPMDKSDQVLMREAKKQGYFEEEIDEALSFEPEKYEAEIAKDKLKRINTIRKIFKKSPLVSPGKVKPLIHKVTGLKKSVASIVTNEMNLLKTQLQAEAKGAKIGEAVGKREIRTEEAIKRKVTGLTDSIKSMGNRKLPVEYKDQVDAVLEKYDLKKRTKKTKYDRKFTTAFIDTMREQGDLAFVPKDYFRDYGEKTTLDEMTLEDLENLHNQIKVLVTIGSNEGKLIAGEKELDLENTVNDLSKTVYGRGKMAEPAQEELRYKPRSVREREKGKYRIQRSIRRKMDAVSKYFSGHRKVENLTKVLHIWDKVWMPIQRATNTELKKGGEMSAKFKQIFSPIAKQSHKMMTDTIQVEGMPDTITRWEAIGVALNSENTGNVERLINGNQYTVGQIKAIKEKLTPQERKFVEDTFKLIDSYWVDTEANTIKATGVKPKKIERGKYFPIKTDYSQDTEAQIRESQKDVMREVFSKAFLERGFIKGRVGGRGPVDLDVLPVILKHLQDVIHYNAFVLPMRDVQKIIHHPKFRKAITDVMGEASYNEFKPWLADTVNPKSLSPKNIFEIGASMLRKNSTAAILGWKVSVSLLQAGSFLQTVNAIGLKSSLGGVADFWKNPKTATDWVYSKSEEMKNRSSLWDRELKDWMESKQAKQILEGLPADAKSTLFVMIRSVDFLTVMPTWIGAYNKEMADHGNEQLAIESADSVVRTTQPMGSIKDLPRMLRGRPYQKFFTMFKSFYTTMHNQLVDIKDEYRFSEDPAISKTAKAALGYWWVWVAPSLLATWIRSGFKEKDPREYVKGIVTFPLSGLFLISDLVSSMASGFEMGVPALKAFKELYYGIKGKKAYTKTKHLVKAFGTFLGKPVDALWTFGEGMGDLITGKTSDPRRLIYSKYALKEKKEDKGKPGRKYIKRTSATTRPRKYIKRKQGTTRQRKYIKRK